MSQKRALIIGCGIAGPAVAIFLKRAGYDPCIYEAQEVHNDYTGLFLNVARNGMRVLAELGVDEQIRREGIEMRAMSFHSSNGKYLGTIGERSGEPQGYTVKRGFPHQVLREAALREGIPVEFGRKLVHMQMTDRQVTAFFEDGTSAKGDFLVGCDAFIRALASCSCRAPWSPNIRG